MDPVSSTGTFKVLAKSLWPDPRPAPTNPSFGNPYNPNIKSAFRPALMTTVSRTRMSGILVLPMTAKKFLNTIAPSANGQPAVSGKTGIATCIILDRTESGDRFPNFPINGSVTASKTRAVAKAHSTVAAGTPTTWL